MQIPKVSVEGLQYLPISVENSRYTHFVANFTIEMIGNEGRACTKISETQQKLI